MPHVSIILFKNREKKTVQYVEENSCGTIIQIKIPLPRLIYNVECLLLTRCFSTSKYK